ncbi:MAG: hypothetical protein HXS54_16325 [Theionarchaea archaeon]|nr:hypothetical protein [Theionarchaea archaeon]
MSMRLTIQQKRKQYRIIYDAIWEDPRIFVKDLALLLGCTPTAAGNRLKESTENDFIIGPEIRKKSYNNLKEYMYFIKCKDPEHLYMNLREDPHVIYHAKTSGPYNMWIIAKEKMDVKEEIVLEGYRSDYYIPHAPDHTWKTALEIMEEKINAFHPDTYQPRHIIKTHFDETIDWSIEDETLYKYFKYNLRNNIEPVMKKYQISAWRVYIFLNNLPATCTVFADYYPDSISSYDPYLFMIETDYEDFVIDLFSELPTTASFFKISGNLFLCIYIPKKFARGTDLNLSNKLYIPLILVNLLEKGIIRNKEHVIIEYSKGKKL